VRKLGTSVPGLMLTQISKDHAAALYELIQDNRSHLTAYGDYADLVTASPDEILTELAETAGQKLRFGIFLQQKLVGRIDIIPVDPPRYGLGYWLAQNSTGRGYATAALQAVLEFARADLQASDTYAGVTHGNWRSVAVLERAGFRSVERFEKHTRFHRSLTAD